MSNRQIEGGKDGRFSLSGDLSFVTVPEIWAHARLLCKADAHLTVDLKGVTRADSSGLALLIECLREARRSRTELSFVNMPEQMRAIARVTGVEGILPFAPGPE